MNENPTPQNSKSREPTSNPAPEPVQPITGLGRVRNWLGLERNILVMNTTIMILGLGQELWIHFVPKYLELLGAGVWVIAIYGTLKSLLGAIYQYPGGWFADRLGRRSALMLFALLPIIGYVVYLTSPNWQWFLVGTLFVVARSSMSKPAIFAIIGDNLPRTRRAIGFGVQSILKRGPKVLGPLLGGWLIISLGLALGIKLGVGVSIVMALVGIAVVRRHYVEKAKSTPDKARFGDIWRSMDARLKRLLVADCLARWAGGLPKVFIILYVINILKAQELQFGLLTSIQMLVSISVYIPIAKVADRTKRKPFVMMTFALFALFPLALVSAPNFFWVVLAFMINGLREIGEPARKALIVDLAKETARGRTIGMYHLMRSLVVFPASLVGALLWKIDPKFVFYSAFVVGVVGFLVYAVWGPGGELLTQAQGSTEGGSG